MPVYLKEQLMNIYFAPLEGVTDFIYRRTHAAFFKGVDKYFIPFVSPTHHLVFTPKEKRSVSPDIQQGCRAVSLGGRAAAGPGISRGES